jgi:ribonuclease D
MANYLYFDDLPSDLNLQGDLAIDTETKGLNIYQRDNLCVVQISTGDGDAHLVHFKDYSYDKAENLKALLSDDSRLKIFHFARFDIAALNIYLGLDIKNVFCTKIASKLTRTYTDRHGLKDLCRELIGVELSKQQQSSDWSSELSKKQLDYAASDVLYLHEIKDKLLEMARFESREQIMQDCFDFLTSRVELDRLGWLDEDIFQH